MITLALAVVLYVAWPRTPAHIAEGPVSAEVTDDSTNFRPRMTEEQLQARRAEREKEDSAVFGQAPAAPAYQTSNR